LPIAIWIEASLAITGSTFKLRHELDIVHGEHVCRISHRERQRCTDARDREHRVFQRDFLRYEFDDGRFDVKEVEVDGGNAVLA
jgi:hypothetical protein